MTSRSNDEWILDLHAEGDPCENALADLRAIVLRGLPFALAGKLSPDHPQFKSLAEDVAQETLLKVLAHLDSFEGRSLFVTWVQKIAVREALGELRRRRWRDVPLPEMIESGEDDTPVHEMADPAPHPEVLVERNDLLQRVNRIVSEELTEKQHQAVELLARQGLPIEIAARCMGIKPNALYKLMFDARARLKRRLDREDLTPAQILSVFERGAG